MNCHSVLLVAGGHLGDNWPAWPSGRRPSQPGNSNGRHTTAGRNFLLRWPRAPGQVTPRPPLVALDDCSSAPTRPAGWRPDQVASGARPARIPSDAIQSGSMQPSRAVVQQQSDDWPPHTGELLCELAAVAAAAAAAAAADAAANQPPLVSSLAAADEQSHRFSRLQRLGFGLEASGRKT